MTIADKFLEKENTPIIKKKKHMYLAYRGLEQDYQILFKKQGSFQKPIRTLS